MSEPELLVHDIDERFPDCKPAHFLDQRGSMAIGILVFLWCEVLCDF
jgi:hypothetical protein